MAASGLSSIAATADARAEIYVTSSLVAVWLKIGGSDLL